MGKPFKFKTTSERSRLMSKIRSTNTKAEIVLRKKLWNAGIRYRINYNKLPGKPDIVITKKKIAIFVDGEFWHGYKWKEKKPRIKANREYWIPKIERNISRAKKVNKILKKQGWIAIRFWEQDVKQQIEQCVHKIISMTNEIDQPTLKLNNSPN